MNDAIRYIFVGIGIGTLVMGLWVLYCLAQFSKKEKGMRRYYQNTNNTIIFEGLRSVWHCSWLTRWEKVQLTLLRLIRGKR